MDKRKSWGFGYNLVVTDNLSKFELTVPLNNYKAQTKKIHLTTFLTFIKDYQIWLRLITEKKNKKFIGVLINFELFYIRR